MSDRPRGDPGWAWYEREVARLETALAEEREKNERLTNIERAARTVVSLWERAEELADEGGGDLLHDATNNLAAALASTGSEER